MKRQRPGNFEVGKGKPAFKRQNATVTAVTVKSVVPKNNNLFVSSNKQRPEQKNVDLTTAITLPLSGAFSALTDLNVVAQGTSSTTRVGRKIVMTSLDLRWEFTLATTSAQGSPVRILIVYDKQTNAALPAATDVLTTSNFLSPMNLANSERFIVVASQISEPVSVQNNFSVAGQIYKKMRLEVVFNDTNAGTVADIQTGGLFLMVAQDAQIITTAPSFQYYSRVRFEDA